MFSFFFHMCFYDFIGCDLWYFFRSYVFFNSLAFLLLIVWFFFYFFLQVLYNTFPLLMLILFDFYQVSVMFFILAISVLSMHWRFKDIYFVLSLFTFMLYSWIIFHNLLLSLLSSNHSDGVCLYLCLVLFFFMHYYFSLITSFLLETNRYRSNSLLPGVLFWLMFLLVDRCCFCYIYLFCIFVLIF